MIVKRNKGFKIGCKVVSGATQYLFRGQEELERTEVWEILLLQNEL